MMIGYATVSPEDEQTAIGKLAAAGCESIYTDRPNQRRWRWAKVTLILREGDTVAVPSLAHLGKSSERITTIAADLAKRGTHLVALDDAIDTRLRGGTEALKAQTQKMRSRYRLSGERIARMKQMYFAKATDGFAEYSEQQISGAVGVHPHTIYKHLTKEDREKRPPVHKPKQPKT